jgi:hypothetical protein
VAEAESAARDANDAWSAAADHFQQCAGTYSQLFEPTHLLGSPNELADFRDFTATKQRKRDEFGHGNAATSSFVIENRSQY